MRMGKRCGIDVNAALHLLEVESYIIYLVARSTIYSVTYNYSVLLLHLMYIVIIVILLSHFLPMDK